jgi:hypothetical protein
LDIEVCEDKLKGFWKNHFVGEVMELLKIEATGFSVLLEKRAFSFDLA